MTAGIPETAIRGGDTSSDDAEEMEIDSTLARTCQRLQQLMETPMHAHVRQLRRRLGPFLTHFSAPCHIKLAVLCALLNALHIACLLGADGVLTWYWQIPMLWPIHVCRSGDERLWMTPPPPPPPPPPPCPRSCRCPRFPRENNGRGIRWERQIGGTRVRQLRHSFWIITSFSALRRPVNTVGRALLSVMLGGTCNLCFARLTSLGHDDRDHQDHDSLPVLLRVPDVPQLRHHFGPFLAPFSRRYTLPRALLWCALLSTYADWTC